MPLGRAFCRAGAGRPGPAEPGERPAIALPSGLTPSRTRVDGCAHVSPHAQHPLTSHVQLRTRPSHVQGAGRPPLSRAEPAGGSWGQTLAEGLTTSP